MPPEELQASSQFFRCHDRVTQVGHDSTIIGRYSVYPFYQEVWDSVRDHDSVLINSPEQANYCMDIEQWLPDFEDISPRIYRPGVVLPEDKSFVLKGQTFSKKFQWDTHMFAPTRDDVATVRARLLDDTWLSQKPIHVREYVPLITYLNGLNGLRITKEFRLWYIYQKFLVGSFYWQSHLEDMNDAGIAIPDISEVPVDLIKTIGQRVGNKNNLFTADVAQTEDGRWILIELNEGQQSGLGTVDPTEFYKLLSQRV